MDVKINKLYEIFLYAQEVGFDYAIVTSLRTSPKLKEFLEDLDPELPLDWSGQSFYGLPELRKHVVKTQDYHVSEDDIMITAGTNEANFLVMMQTINPGDEIVIDMPSWPQPYELGKALGANIKIVKRRESLKWNIDLNELKKLVTPQTRLIFLCSPNNPTGAVFNEEEMKRICQIAQANGSYLLLMKSIGAWNGITSDLQRRSTTTRKRSALPVSQRPSDFRASERGGWPLPTRHFSPNASSYGKTRAR